MNEKQQATTLPPDTLPKTTVEFKTVIQELHTHRIESTINADNELAQLVNNGWTVAHETVNTVFETSLDWGQVTHYRIIRLERVVQPDQPLVEVAAKPDVIRERQAMNDEKTEKIPIIEIENPVPVANKPDLIDKLAEDKPIFTALTKHGLDKVLEALDAQVALKAHAAYQGSTGAQELGWFLNRKKTPFTPLLTTSTVVRS